MQLLYAGGIPVCVRNHTSFSLRSRSTLAVWALHGLSRPVTVIECTTQVIDTEVQEPDVNLTEQIGEAKIHSEPT